MKINKKLKKETIAHYKRMIKWAKKQPPQQTVNRILMYEKLDEDWSSVYCPYCNYYPKINKNRWEPGGLCWECPLNINDENITCCNNLWKNMDYSNNWKDWIVAAEKVLKYIKDNG